VPVPGVGAPNLDDPMATLQGYVDRAVFGDHIYKKGKYDPEGLLSTIPALATCLFGVEAGRILAGPFDGRAKVRRLLAGGLALLLAGYGWSFVLPLNKELWTSSYAVWTAGIAFVALAVAQWAFDVRGLRRLGHPLQVYGVNALLVFVGSGLVGRIVGSLWTVAVDGKQVAVKEWFFRTCLLPIGDPKLASLLFAMLWILGWYAVLAQLYRRGIVWKV
jgi:predicted acyltransferase